MDQQELLYLNDMIDSTIILTIAAYKAGKIPLKEKQRRLKETLRNKNELAAMQAKLIKKDVF
jgi:hypothetical protein